MERVLRALIEMRQMFSDEIVKGIPDYNDYREKTGVIKGLDRAIGEVEEAIRKERQEAE